MAASTTLSLTALIKYFSDEHKSVSRGENHYRSGHVLSFQYSDGIMIGTVQASMKNKDYNVKVHLNDGLDITNTFCECPRGEYKCSHSVALFLHALNNLSRTDVECKWKKKKRPADEHIKTAEDLFPSKVKYDPLSRHVTAEDKEWFFSQLSHSGQFTGLHWLMRPEPDNQANTLPLVEDVLKDPQLASACDRKLHFLGKMKLSRDMIRTTALLTKGQSSNASWHLVRKGRLTASNFGSVILAKKISQSLVKRVLGGHYLGGVKAIAWGSDHEKEAISEFSTKLGLIVEETGVWLDESGLLGASPDGLIGEDAILEIKCPYSHRNDTIDQCIIDSKFCLYFSDDHYHLKKTHPYWHQVQGQLHLTCRSFCYFVIWTKKVCHYVSIEKDETWKGNLDLLKDFYKTHIFPTL